jgi:hypothetical protein
VSKRPPSSSKKDKLFKKENSKKKSTRYRGDPSSSEPDSDGDPSDHDSDGSNSSYFEHIIPKVKATTRPDGVTPFVFRSYVNASHLEDFDEKAALAIRVRQLERFQSFAVQGGWTDEVKIYEMKLKLSGPVRNWRANLDPKIRRKWKSLLKEFREMH